MKIVYRGELIKHKKKPSVESLSVINSEHGKRGILMCPFIQMEGYNLSFPFDNYVVYE
jgi:hypothetical protein